ncbi:MAG: hypothetical protein AAGC71_16085 [Pseudomonadota bacterium]
MRAFAIGCFVLCWGVPAAAGPCSGTAFEQFSFWAGQWQVSTADGTVVGHNTISRVADGCALIERWESVRGSTGTSLNYYDVAQAQWVQVWSGAGGTQIDIRGGIADGSMVLVGTLTTIANNTTVPFRGTWTLLDDGRVRQFFEQSVDAGETWQPWFEGFYKRQSAPSD